MRNNKLIQFMGSLSKKELQGFIKYVQARYGKYKVAIGLLDQLKSRHPDFSGKGVEAEVLIRKLSIADNHRPEKRLLNEASRLYKWLEDYLLLEKLKAEGKSERERLLTEIFRERNLSHLLKLKTDQLLSGQEAAMPLQKWSFLDRLYFLDHKYYYSDQGDDLHQKGETVLHELMQQLDAFYLICKLQYGCEMLNRQNVLREQYDIPYWSFAARLSFEQAAALSPLHAAFYLAARLLDKQEKSDYDHLKKYLFQQADSFHPEVQLILQTYLLNYAAVKFRANEEIPLQELFELNRFGVDRKLFLEDGMIASLKFINIVAVACSMGKFAWAESFIRDWKGYLKSEVREAAVAVSEVLILFEQKAYRAMLDRLTGLKSPEPSLDVRIRALYLIALTEAQMDAEMILSHCRNFESYLHRNRVLGEGAKDAVFNFLKVLKAFVRAYTSTSSLMEQVNLSQNIYYRSWLIQKIEERDDTG